MINLLLNCLLFLFLINIGWLAERRHNPDLQPKPLAFSVGLPLALGISLSVVDRLRLVFFQQAIIFIILAGICYWFFTVITKR